MVLRTTTAFIAMPILFAAIWYGTPFLTALVSLTAIIGFWELRNLTEEPHNKSPLIPGFIWSIILVSVGGSNPEYLLGIISIGILTTITWLAITARRGYSLATWGINTAGPLYIALPLTFGLLIRNLEDGREWLLFVICITFVTDSTAYLIGRYFGSHQLAPTVSPRKTWEGSIAGLFGAMGAAVGFILVLNLFTDTPDMVWWHAIILGAILGLTAQAGDLAESFIKRLAGIKDASRILPGHGGVLDRIDSIVFTLVVMYYWIQLVE